MGDDHNRNLGKYSVLVSFYLGIVYLKLVAIEILVAFILAQLGYVFYKSKNIYWIEEKRK